MADVRIEIHGLKELQKKLSTDDFKKAINTSLLLGAGTARVILREYPRQKRGRKQPFKSDKQRRFFFAALRDGRIRVPYRRTGKLAKKWKIRSPRWNVAITSNDIGYGPLVQNRPTQSAFHKEGDWRTTDDVATQHDGQIIKDVAKGIVNYLRRF